VITKPTVFRAVMMLFPEVAQRVKDKYGKSYTTEHFTQDESLLARAKCIGEPPRCTTMHGGRRQSGCSGSRFRAGAGGSIGLERIAVRDPSGFRGRQLFVFDIPERQINSWLSHARFLGRFMLEMFLRIPSHD
jgi:hypothetical protein